MRNNAVEGTLEPGAGQVKPDGGGCVTWQRVLVEGALLLAMLLTSSWLIPR